MKDANETMRVEIEEAIQKNMPNQVGVLLKKRLEQAESDAKSLESEREFSKQKSEKIVQLEKIISEYKAFDDRNTKLEARELAVTEKERNQKVFEAELRVAEAEKRITDNVNFVGMVFRSPIFRESVSKSVQGDFVYNNATMRNEFVKNGAGEFLNVTKEMD
jgi:hypothetical protein